MDELKGLSTSAARDYLKDVLELSDVEIEALEASDYSPEILAEAAGILSKDGRSKDEIKESLRDQFPEVFDFEMPVCAADVEDEVHHFLWNPYIPLKEYTVIMAAAGTGKTFVSSWLAAQVTNGGFFPADRDFYAQDEARRTGSKPEPGNVLYISSEERIGELRGRVRKSGGDVSRFFAYDKLKSKDMNFTTGFSKFIMRVNAVKPKLVIIDPWQSFIGKEIDTNKVNHVRPAMQQLSLIAERCNCAIILISHVNKKPQGENINNAAIGSTEFVNAARSAMMVISDEEDPDGRILVHTKSNYAAAGDSLKFHITQDGGFVYDGISMVTKSILEAAARNRKTVAEMMVQQKDDREARAKLIEKMRELAEPIKPGESTIIAYEEMLDYYGDDIFNGAKRPGAFIKKVMMALDQYGIEIRLTTESGKPKKVTYNDKTRNGFEIYKKI